MTNLLATAAASAGIVLIGLSLFFGSPSPDERSAVTAPAAQAEGFPQPWASVSPVAATEPQATSSPSQAPPRDLRTYAIQLTELAGLPADASPGTRMELWVAWDPALTKGPRIERLLRSVTLQKIAPPAIEGNPPVALLAVIPRDVEKLLWGDRYGSLSAVLLAGA